MTVISAFVLLILLYSLVSRRMERTLLTPPIFFLLGGVLLLLCYPHFEEMMIKRESFLLMAEIGLVMLLFTDATHIPFKVLKDSRQLPVRLLTAGMLLTILAGTLCGVLLLPISFWEAGILAAILAPTDAGLGQVIVQSPRVPKRIRQALDVEAGLNDGLSVPFLMFFIAVASYGTDGGGMILGRFLFEQLGIGAAVGCGIGLVGGFLLGRAQERGWMTGEAQQLGLVSLPLLSVLACKATGGSMFIAAYAAGIAVRVGYQDVAAQSLHFTEGWGQLFDFFIFFYFGMVATFLFGSLKPVHLLYALLSLTVVRMLPVAVSMLGLKLRPATLLFLGWFGPRGLASIVLGLVFLEEATNLPGEETIKLVVVATVLLSILAHGVTALPGIELYARMTAPGDGGPTGDA
ncbi:sodium:proton antiporter [Desulfuromonas sp. TF]|uniref:cation:proton antiporter n=1 Tax=Desulfuromonas sp. TF TaxID=1232410 RepID=UPI0004112B5F|nr:cation:proton antiporter [Desulfuromonas sp. TF]